MRLRDRTRPVAALWTGHPAEHIHLSGRGRESSGVPGRWHLAPLDADDVSRRPDLLGEELETTVWPTADPQQRAPPRLRQFDRRASATRAQADAPAAAAFLAPAACSPERAWSDWFKRITFPVLYRQSSLPLRCSRILYRQRPADTDTAAAPGQRCRWSSATR